MCEKSNKIVAAEVRECCSNSTEVGRVTPCAPPRNLPMAQACGAHGVTRPTFSRFDRLGNTPLPRLLRCILTLLLLGLWTLDSGLWTATAAPPDWPQFLGPHANG